MSKRLRESPPDDPEQQRRELERVLQQTMQALQQLNIGTGSEQITEEWTLWIFDQGMWWSRAYDSNRWYYHPNMTNQAERGGWHVRFRPRQ